MFLQVAEMMIHEGLEAALSLNPPRIALRLAKGALIDEGYDDEAGLLDAHLKATKRRVGRPRAELLSTYPPVKAPEGASAATVRTDHIAPPRGQIRVQHGTGPAVLRVDGPYTLVTRAEARQG